MAQARRCPRGARRSGGALACTGATTQCSTLPRSPALTPAPAATKSSTMTVLHCLSPGNKALRGAVANVLARRGPNLDRCMQHSLLHAHLLLLSFMKGDQQALHSLACVVLLAVCWGEIIWACLLLPYRPSKAVSEHTEEMRGALVQARRRW